MSISRQELDAIAARYATPKPARADVRILIEEVKLARAKFLDLSYSAGVYEAESIKEIAELTATVNELKDRIRSLTSGG